MKRLFLAMNISDEVKNDISVYQKVLADITKKSSITKIDNIHLTLHFFGDTDEENLEKIKKLLRTIRSDKRSIILETSGLGVFKRSGEYLVWLGFKANDGLSELKITVDKTLGAAGFKTERREFKPHVTIARRTSFIRSAREIDEIRVIKRMQKVDDMILYSSHFTNHGVQYKVEDIIKL